MLSVAYLLVKHRLFQRWQGETKCLLTCVTRTVRGRIDTAIFSEFLPESQMVQLVVKSFGWISIFYGAVCAKVTDLLMTGPTSCARSFGRLALEWRDRH